MQESEAPEEIAPQDIKYRLGSPFPRLYRRCSRQATSASTASLRGSPSAKPVENVTSPGGKSQRLTLGQSPPVQVSLSLEANLQGTEEWHSVSNPLFPAHQLHPNQGHSCTRPTPASPSPATADPRGGDREHSRRQKAEGSKGPSPVFFKSLRQYLPPRPAGTIWGGYHTNNPSLAPSCVGWTSGQPCHPGFQKLR